MSTEREITGGDASIVTQEVQTATNLEQGAESGLSLETPEQADARIAATMGQIAESNHIAEVAQAADIAETQPKIEEIRKELGLPTETQVGASTEVEVISATVISNTENLERRMRGEISGSALDRLDAENEERIDSARAEMRRKIEEAQSHRNDVEISTPAQMIPTDSQLQEAAVSSSPAMEKVGVVESESSRFKKFSEGEIFTDNIESATDTQSLLRRLSELGDITAPDGYVYKKEDTLNTIGLLKDSKDPNLQRITNTHGLRDKVRKLLLQREIQ